MLYEPICTSSHQSPTHSQQLSPGCSLSKSATVTEELSLFQKEVQFDSYLDTTNTTQFPCISLKESTSLGTKEQDNHFEDEYEPITHSTLEKPKEYAKLSSLLTNELPDDIESLSELSKDYLANVDPRKAQLWMLLQMQKMVQKIENVYETVYTNYPRPGRDHQTSLQIELNGGAQTVQKNQTNPTIGEQTGCEILASFQTEATGEQEENYKCQTWLEQTGREQSNCHTSQSKLNGGAQTKHENQSSFQMAPKGGAQQLEMVTRTQTKVHMSSKRKHYVNLSDISKMVTKLDLSSPSQTHKDKDYNSDYDDTISDMKATESAKFQLPHLQLNKMLRGHKKGGTSSDSRKTLIQLCKQFPPEEIIGETYYHHWKIWILSQYYLLQIF